MWEQLAAVARLRELGRAEVDENALFAMVARMRDITEEAAATSRKARRDAERRRSNPPRSHTTASVPDPPTSDPWMVAAAPFEVIEQW
ncbi:hypothetical protein ABN034_12690 [Actinopolymorpha sp. B11F2]|uniref:hypothetical protein n=1 Tax=Actinopolymorpha sp. B11F2 TaxID=3160862 RepID=UPI0032E49DA8